MATISDISRLCKSGEIGKARELALVDIEKYPDFPWPLTNYGWVLYYQIKTDLATASNRQKVMEAIADFCELNIPADGNDILFQNILFVIARFAHLNLPETDPNSEHLFSVVFSKLRDAKVLPCMGASYLLDRALDMVSDEGFHRMVEHGQSPAGGLRKGEDLHRKEYHVACGKGA